MIVFALYMSFVGKFQSVVSVSCFQTHDPTPQKISGNNLIAFIGPMLIIFLLDVFKLKTDVSKNSC